MFCKKLNNGLKKAIEKFDALAQKAVGEALETTAILKDFIAGGTVDVLLQLIGGNKPLEIRTAIQAGLEKAIAELGEIKTCTAKPTLRERLVCYAFYIKGLTDKDQHSKLQKTASIIAATIDSNRLDEHLYDTFTQAQYSASKLAA